MLLPVMIVRFQQGWFQMLLIDLPLFLASTCSILASISSRRESFAQDLAAQFLYLPFVMATGIGISVRNAQAVLEASLERKRIRAHAKFNIEASRAPSRKSLTGKKPAGCPTRKSFSGSIFSMTVVYAIINENYATVPSCYSSFGAISTPAACRSAKLTLRACVSASTLPKCARNSGAPGFDLFYRKRVATGQVESASRSSSLETSPSKMAKLACTQLRQDRRTAGRHAAPRLSGILVWVAQTD